jgi:hypothetical protein
LLLPKTAASPTPPTARAPQSRRKLGERDAKAKPATARNRPILNTTTCPNRSAALPRGSTNIATASVKATRVSTESTEATPKSLATRGRDTPKALVENGATNELKTTETNT